MYYLNARYYNPELGRFINADSIGGKVGELLSHNVFAYCTNNPVNLDDPSGCWPNWGKIFEAAKMVVNKVAEAVSKVTQFLTPSTQTKVAVAMSVGFSSYKFFKPQKVSAKGTGNTSNYGKLKSLGNGKWKSSQGLVYGPDKKFGNRVQHVLAHGKPDLSKGTHTVFNVGKDKILRLVDEAWSIKGNASAGDPGAYLVNMGRTIGTDGEAIIKIIVKPGTNEIITAYPIK